MNWQIHRKKSLPFMEIGLSALMGLFLGALLIISSKLAPEWQGIVLIIPIGLSIVLLFNDPEKVVLAAIAISVPLNLDISLIISPYAQNSDNFALGKPTLIALTELRLSLVLIMLLIGYLLWLAPSPNRDRKSVRFFASTTVPALGLIFFSILSGLNSPDMQLYFFRIVQLFELFLAYFYLANHIRTINDMRFFVLVFLAGMLAESLLMILQWVTGLSFSVAGIKTTTYGPGRGGGTLGHPGPAAGYISAMAVIAGAMIWAFTRKSRRILAAACFGFGVIALVSTGSRIGWAAFAVTLPLALLVGLKRGWVKRETLVVLAVALLIFGAIFFPIFYNRLTVDDYGSVASRLMMYKLAWNMIRENPWFGVGAGNSALLTKDYFTYAVGDPEMVLNMQVHNKYLLIWAENGTFALLCYLCFLGSAVMKAWSCVKSDHPWISLMGIGLCFAILSLCIQMLTGTFLVRPITLFSWLLPALAVSLLHIEQTRSVLNN